MAETAPAEKTPAEGAPAAKEEEAVPTPPVKQTRSIYLTGFGGPKYVRLQAKDQKTVGKGEIAVEVEAWEHPQGVTVVLDSRSGEDTNKGISLLQPMGRYVIYGSSNFVTGDRKNLFSFAKSWIQMDRINPLKLQEESKVLGGFSLRSLIFRQHAQLSTIFEAWQELSKLFSEKKIEPIVDSVWCFEEAKEAMQKLQERNNIGKVVLNPKLQPKAPEPEVKATENEGEAKVEDKETAN
nr:unnamed protein product [Spirometra erinaceieuropaei]